MSLIYWLCNRNHKTVTTTTLSPTWSNNVRLTLTHNRCWWRLLTTRMVFDFFDTVNDVKFCNKFPNWIVFCNFNVSYGHQHKISVVLLLPTWSFQYCWKPCLCWWKNRIETFKVKPQPFERQELFQMDYWNRAKPGLRTVWTGLRLDRTSFIHHVNRSISIRSSYCVATAQFSLWWCTDLIVRCFQQIPKVTSFLY